MLPSLLAIIVPTFGIVGIGWFCRARGIFTGSAVHGLNAYAYLIALPALIFEAVFTQMTRDGLTLHHLRYLAALVIGHLAVFVLAVLVLRHARRDLRVLGPTLLAFGSTAYLGIPFATFAFGDAGTVYAALGSVVLVVAVLLAALMLLNTSARRETRTATWHQLLELPFLWVVLAGILLPIVGIRELPEFLARTLAILSGSAGPTALLALGAYQYDLPLRSIPWRSAIPVGIGKVIFPTAASTLTLLAFGVTGIPLIVGMSLGATSAAVTAFVLADEYRIGRELTAGVMIVSAVASLVMLSALMISWFTIWPLFVTRW